MWAESGEHIARTRWPIERIRAERDKGLRRVLRAAIDGSPWFHSRLSGISPEDFQFEDLRSLPVMTKADLIENFDDIVTDRRVTTDVVERHLASLEDDDAYLLGAYHAAVSGGSSGVRALFAFDWDSWKTYYLAAFRYIYRIRLEATGTYTKPALTAVLATPHAAHITSGLRQTFQLRNMPSIGLSVEDPLEKNVSRLNEIQPEALVTYPSALQPLLQAARAGELRISPKSIISVTEPLVSDLRDAVHSAFPSSLIFNWYVASEGGCIAVGCGSGPGMHLSEDLVILEAVTADGRPVPPGIRSDKIYVTNLANRLMPVIRYELDDQVTLVPRDEPCPCGSHHQRIADVEGRRREMFRYPGGVVVHSMRLYSVLIVDPAIAEFQIRQTPKGIAVKVRGNDPDLPEVTRKLRAELIGSGLPGPEVTIDAVDRIERLEISGKLARFIPLPPGQGDQG
jgi:phenylacetate-coenzyme A ligase PaaK-like adenylate-forming protein